MKIYGSTKDPEANPEDLGIMLEEKLLEQAALRASSKPAEKQELARLDGVYTKVSELLKKTRIGDLGKLSFTVTVMSNAQNLALAPLRKDLLGLGNNRLLNDFEALVHQDPGKEKKSWLSGQKRLGQKILDTVYRNSKLRSNANIEIINDALRVMYYIIAKIKKNEA